ncbi:protein of unknown function DUF1566 [Candidatus Magnetoovum chiemensis]|nr:protein of unknown function DUF1566 [Candidatus Magnetoovum chiemensis]
MDTSQEDCYNQIGAQIICPSSEAGYYGQDAQYTIIPASYEFNSSETVVKDLNTGLMWQQDNAVQSGADYQFTWQEALSYCESLSLAGYSDWRLPNVKELQSIVDYTNSDPAIDTSVFTFNETSGAVSYFWSSTTDLTQPKFDDYICFGPCLSINDTDIHGPGAQRSDPKYDDGTDYSSGLGDQEDVVQIYNYVRCVRGDSLALSLPTLNLWANIALVLSFALLIAYKI